MTKSRSEAGKLNTGKSREVSRQKKQKNSDLYYASPKKCKHCDAVIPYEKRANQFCGSVCSATYTNARKDWDNIRTGPTPSVLKHIPKARLPKIEKEQVCKNCGTIKRNLKYFCSRQCQTEYQKKQKIVDWKSGKHVGKKQIKRYIEETYGYKCSVCKIIEWNGKRIGLELEHKDGNSENNKEENLCLICPNCHSQTDTYKAKNKGNGRHWRKKRYQEGKSY